MEANPEIASAAALRDIDRLVRHFYGAFDNREGKVPVFEALRDLFAKDAIVTRVTVDGVETWRRDEFIIPRIAMLTDGTLSNFHEWEVEERTTIFGGIASRSSTYCKEGLLAGAPYAGSGRKLIQLHRVGRRWVINSVLWQDTSPQ